MSASSTTTLPTGYRWVGPRCRALSWVLTNAQERRRVEEQYVQGLRKLANRHPPDESSDLGYLPAPFASQRTS
ncbi:hypothetical protein IG631_10178 [Alternaria alternata]|nr:hypothetical protein IG631_10178 [Alternaria alternata]